MTIFKLPDLGEGLPEAEIVAWHVREGDEVRTDQLMVSVETAKAVVDVPSPCSGRIVRLCAQVGDTVPTGAPLVEFAGEQAIQAPAAAEATQGMVVGHMAASATEYVDRGVAGSARASTRERVRALPAVRMLAKRLNVELAACGSSGRHGLVSMDDVLAAARLVPAGREQPSLPGAEPLRGARKAMARSMTLARDEVATCTVFDDADIESWQGTRDITVRLLRAIVAGVRAEPALNALFDPTVPARKVMSEIHVALAVDVDGGLIVPVLRNVGELGPAQLREAVNSLKERTRNRTLQPAEMRDYTITLSNFGTLAGRYATPLVVPPSVAILGAGRLQRDVVAGATAPEIHTRLPLSLTFDHRCITGGEACRFLAAVIADLQQPQ